MNTTEFDWFHKRFTLSKRFLPYVFSKRFTMFYIVHFTLYLLITFKKTFDEVLLFSCKFTIVSVLICINYMLCILLLYLYVCKTNQIICLLCLYIIYILMDIDVRNNIYMRNWKVWIHTLLNLLVKLIQYLLLCMR